MAVKKETPKSTSSSKRILKKAKNTDSRINKLEDTFQDSVEKLAYDIWEKRGCQPSDGLSEWLEAEQIIKDKISAN